MKKVAFAFCSILLPITSQADDGFDAARFHQQHCTTCHDSSVYTRPDHKIRSRAQLASQLRMCDANLADVKLSNDQMQALVEYLDHEYYGFGQ